MSTFTRNEIKCLGRGLLGRLATVGRDGTPHVAPLGTFSHNAELDIIDVGGHELTSTKKYFRDAARTGQRGRRQPQAATVRRLARPARCGDVRER